MSWSGRGVGGRWAAAVAVVLAVALGVPAGVAADAAQPQSEAQAQVAAGPAGVLAPGGSWTVTLLTGQVLDVHADAEGRVTATARQPAEPFFTVRRPDGELYAIPLAVTALLDDVLDRELFNVTGLIRQGYDDASIDVVPLIVQRRPGADLRSALATGEDERPLPSIGAVATEVAKADTEATGELLADLNAAAGRRAAQGVTRVWLDRQVTTLPPPASSAPAADPAELDPNLTQIGADRAWAAGLSGEGVTVAVLDSGIDGAHPDLAGRVVAEANFGASEDAVDRIGHGTHVAAIIAGTGAAAGGARSGVAPDADLISVKVVDDFGGGFESEAIAGMEWAAPQADVVNMSLGYGLGSDGTDPISLALDALSEQHDTLFVVAAGNSGPTSRSVEFPGAAERALTVGAVDMEDRLAPFSSRGPLEVSSELKPEVVAPGVDVVAARAAGTAIGDPVDELYTAVSGTSMATPHAAGAAAVLAQQHPDWTADQLRRGIIAAADPIGADGFDAGAGRIDIGDGVAATVRAERDVVDVPLAHPRTEPRVETLAWTNTSAETQTVRLAADLEDREGAPVGAVAIEPAELSLAPGATGAATLTVDGQALDPGLYSGIVTADPAGGPNQDDLRTPVGVHAEGETAELTIQPTSPNGAADPFYGYAIVANLDDFGEFGEFVQFEDTTTLTVPLGRYAVVGAVFSLDGDADAIALVGDPDVAVTGDTTVAFDGAAAAPLDPTVEGVRTAPPLYSGAALTVTPRAGTGGFGLQTEVLAWYPMPPVRVAPMEGDPERFAAHQLFRLQAPYLTAAVGDEPVEVVGAEAGRLPVEGTTTLRAVDVGGDEGDLSGARGGLAVVRLPADAAERAAVTQRAADAGVALVAFVDPGRPFLTLSAAFPETWAGIPVIAAAGAAAARLQAAATAGEDVTVTVAASPYVYDIVTPDRHVVDPAPVIDRAAQRELATLRERFHRDTYGVGAVADRRYPISVTLLGFDAVGPLPRRRTAHVTPGVTWQSIVFGPGFFRDEWEPEPIPVNPTALSMDAGVAYAPGSDTVVRWLRRPQWPGPVGGPMGASFCQPTPVRRTADTMLVWLAPFQDGRDRFGCSDPHESTLTLERDGAVIGTADEWFADFPVPAEPSTYRLSYEQRGQGPYPHRSSTTWTFRSQTPGDFVEPIPLLVVDYTLPLDTLNRPTGTTATFTVDQVTGSADHPIRRLRVWTSTNDGTTWRPAPVRDTGDGRYRVTLPHTRPGAPVSLRVDATDTAGNRIEQTLHDAYRG